MLLVVNVLINQDVNPLNVHFRSVGPQTPTLASGDEVALIGFGTFKINERAARTGRNPRTGEEIQIAAAKVPAFKAGKALKEAVNI